MKKVSYRKTHKGRGRALGRFVACLSAVLVCFLTSCSACTAVRIEWEFDLSLVEGVKTDSVTRLYYFNGAGEATELEDGVLCGSRISSYVPLSDMPRELLDAFVAIEDKNFFRHHGVDVLRTVRAGINYFTRLSPAYGASTITQQLVKNLTGKDEVTPARKLQEIVYAVDLERKLDKTEILELYLNIINLSESCYGVGAAAERYFSKSVGELNLAECACLAAITKNPSYYDPVTNPANNAERRRVILAEMLEQGYIGREEYDTWYLYEPELNLTEFKRGVSSWYTDMVVEDVICDLVAEFGYSRAAASRAVYGGGLRIYTLQDPEIQRCVEDYYSDASNFPEDNEQGRSAVIVIDPESGAVLGVAGAIGEKCADRVQSYATDTRRPVA